MKIRGSRLAWAAGFAVAALLTGAPAPAQTATRDDDLVRKGEYIATLGDCTACHTAPGGKPFAGGLAFKTPTGTIYSTNITPDPKTGIGGYTLEQFGRAVRRGRAADGHRLYPAMPFVSYAKMTEEDLEALYAYVTKAVAPVEQANRASEMLFPFNIRLAMAVWDFAFLDTSPFKPDAAKDADWNRGAYLVESLAHCGTCHTPRGFGMQEKALSDDGQTYLAGSTIDGWRSISLRRPFPEADLVELLKTGATKRSMVFGPMTELIQHSSQKFTDSDLRAIAHYIASLAPVGATQPTPVAANEANMFGTRGGLGYVQFCAACHRADGLGAEKIFPALAANPAILSDDPTSVVHIMLTGWRAARTEAAPHGFAMPDFAALGDAEIADILSFVRASWGNKANAVTESQVAALRKDLEAPAPAARSPATPRFADLLAETDKDQLITGMRLMNETKARLPNNVGAGLNCSSCHIDAGSVAKASPFWGLTKLFPMKNPRAGKIIEVEDRLNGCFRRSENGSAFAKDSKDLQAMIAFMNWMNVPADSDGKIPGRGTAKVAEGLKPDPAHGETLYKAQCAFCHGVDGDGAKDSSGRRMFPPLWGDASFNIGAGMARTFTAAGFLKANMPIAHSEGFPQAQGGLSDQDAVDLAEFFTHQPRPDFPDKVKDWPNGAKPVDARY